MGTSNHLLPLVLLWVCATSCAGFECHVCSYSINTDKTRDCIDRLNTLTAPANYYTCNRTCVIQENFSIQEGKVTSFIRTCQVKVHPNVCYQDAWSKVCYYSCIGPLCNNYPGELHTRLTIVDASLAVATVGPVGDGGGRNPAVSHFRGGVKGISFSFVSMLFSCFLLSLL